MYEFKVELKEDKSGWDDYASYYFSVFARSEAEAWKRADELEGLENIKRLWLVRFIGNI
jgi:hypothetical protein